MKWRIILVVAAMTAMSSCIFTFHPLYSDDVLVDIPGLARSFLDPGSSGSIIAADSAVWTFTKEDLGRYNLEIDQDGRIGSMEVHAVKLGGEFFLDFVVSEVNTDDMPDYVAWHLVPMHTFAKVRIEDGALEIMHINAEWAQENLEKHRIRIDHETRKSGDNTEFILLTASTRDLQKFAEKYARYDDAFEDPDVLIPIMAY